MRRLQEDAGAVARVLFAAAGPAMLEVHEHLEGFLHNRVRFAALEVHDKTAPQASSRTTDHTGLACQESQGVS